MNFVKTVSTAVLLPPTDLTIFLKEETIFAPNFKIILTKYFSTLLKLMSVGLFVVAACKETEEDPVVVTDPDQPIQTTLLDKIKASDSLKVFNRIIETLDQQAADKLSAVLNGTTNYTLFAPIDEAVPPLAIETNPTTGAPVFTEEEAALWRAIVRYHLVPGSILNLSTTFTEDNEPLKTLLDENITIGVQGTTIQVRDSQSAGLIVEKDKAAGNNIIHTIDIVLRPQAFYTAFPPEVINGNTRNMPAFFKTRPELSTLVATIEKVNLSFGYPPGFSDINVSTYFAPTNAAFDSLFVTLGDDYNSLDDFDTEIELQTLTNILLPQHSSSYLCYERMLEEGRSTIYPARLINPQVPRAPDRRNELVTVSDASAPVVTIVDYVYQVADIVLDKSVPACAEGVKDISGNTSIVLITDLVLLKPGFLTPNEPD